jgi:tRNA threonylcarbamoyl adenosine modification protein YeaZ
MDGFAGVRVEMFSDKTKENTQVRDCFITLSIETSVGGGSVSILANREELDAWSGASQISKAEEILDRISKLLEKNRINKECITRLVVSVGAGSLTGEKIGLAIAKGFSKAIKCPLFQISVFDSLLKYTDTRNAGQYLTAIPFGRNQIQWQGFNRNEFETRATNPVAQISSSAEFADIIKTFVGQKIIFSKGLEQFIESSIEQNEQYMILHPYNLAYLNGKVIANKCVR